MDLTIGQIVISKAGRDKGSAFVVAALKLEGEGNEYAFLVDGDKRPVTNPKKKKRRHLQHTLTIDKELAAAIKSGAHLKDADFRAVLKKFRDFGDRTLTMPEKGT
jgi:ribosomal protein L14E/L6E/L27E